MEMFFCRQKLKMFIPNEFVLNTTTKRLKLVAVFFFSYLYLFLKNISIKMYIFIYKNLY